MSSCDTLRSSLNAAGNGASGKGWSLPLPASKGSSLGLVTGIGALIDTVYPANIPASPKVSRSAARAASARAFAIPDPVFEGTRSDELSKPAASAVGGGDGIPASSERGRQCFFTSRWEIPSFSEAIWVSGSPYRATWCR